MMGIAINGTGAIEVGHVPGRKGWFLYEVVHGEVHVLARIPDHETADRVTGWLYALLGESILSKIDKGPST